MKLSRLAAAAASFSVLAAAPALAQSLPIVGGTLSGNVAVGASNLGVVPLFNLGSSGNPAAPFSLALTAVAAGALTTVFGVPNLTGFVLGNANTIPITAAVPEPATVLSMLAGLGLIGISLRRRQAANADRA